MECRLASNYKRWKKPTSTLLTLVIKWIISKLTVEYYSSTVTKYFFNNVNELSAEELQRKIRYAFVSMVVFSSKWRAVNTAENFKVRVRLQCLITNPWPDSIVNSWQTTTNRVHQQFFHTKGFCNLCNRSNGQTIKEKISAFKSIDKKFSYNTFKYCAP